ncbi:hypothetical protein [Pontibacter burrus]|uniref:Uncharacterized protein n=1 Tax=Pontibacter burrus TaxID=2704466 RepID=A0A6B3LYN8_9BACT|nr:hypothetical protein [Pontibacter burrus]NEM99456.1 hypothetical protein [Pontibacter burrus]
MKTILSVWNSGGKGKSGTIRELARILLANYPGYIPVKPLTINIPSDIDFLIVIEIDGIRVGIVSQGDPGTGLDRKLKELADEHNCDIIICATRTRGETVKIVDRIAKSRGYDTIRTSTYQVSTTHRKLANQLKAKHLLDLLQSLELLPVPELV